MRKKLRKILAVSAVFAVMTVILSVTVNAAPILPNPPAGTPAALAAGAVNFFTLWIGRIGALVAFVGAVKFALSIKSEDAREQIQAVLIMVSGFMIRAAVGNLGLFNFGAAGADAEFNAIMVFIGGWVGRVGALALLIGSIMFGFSIKENNATAKVAGLKTMAAGGITVAVSGILPLFVA